MPESSTPELEPLLLELLLELPLLDPLLELLELELLELPPWSSPPMPRQSSEPLAKVSADAQVTAPVTDGFRSQKRASWQSESVEQASPTPARAVQALLRHRAVVPHSSGVEDTHWAPIAGEAVHCGPVAAVAQ